MLKSVVVREADVNEWERAFYGRNVSILGISSKKYLETHEGPIVELIFKSLVGITFLCLQMLF